MSVDVKAMILAKNGGKKQTTQLVMKDVNRRLITSLLAISVYGKEARDEEILSVIINASTGQSARLARIRDNYDKLVKEKKVKKSKDGFVRDQDGFIVLVPRV